MFFSHAPQEDRSGLSVRFCGINVLVAEVQSHTHTHIERERLTRLLSICLCIEISGSKLRPPPPPNQLLLRGKVGGSVGVARVERADERAKESLRDAHDKFKRALSSRLVNEHFVYSIYADNFCASLRQS